MVNATSPFSSTLSVKHGWRREGTRNSIFVSFLAFTHRTAISNDRKALACLRLEVRSVVDAGGACSVGLGYKEEFSYSF